MVYRPIGKRCTFSFAIAQDANYIFSYHIMSMIRTWVTYKINSIEQFIPHINRIEITIFIVHSINLISAITSLFRKAHSHMNNIDCGQIRKMYATIRHSVWCIVTLN